MDSTALRILGHLRVVEEQRRRRNSDGALAQRVQAVKAYQQRRFASTYRDLSEDTRYRPATRFFLEELYGPGDFGPRDSQFARIVPSLGRLVPGELLAVVESLGELHALSEALDTRMAEEMPVFAVDRATYVRAWRAVQSRSDRDRQLALILGIGRSLDRHTRGPLLRHSLKLMRAPAKAAGLGDLQAFLERGFNAFAAMKSASEFLQVVARREALLISALFGDALPARMGHDASGTDPLADLP
jgi:hypothetical protein